MNRTLDNENEIAFEWKIMSLLGGILKKEKESRIRNFGESFARIVEQGEGGV